LIQPVRKRLILNVRDHGREGMCGTVITEFETLDTARRAWFVSDIFAFVTVFPFRRRKSLTLNGKQCVKLAVSAAFNDECGGTRLHGEVYLSTATRFISGLGSELDMTPVSRVIDSTVEMIAKVFC
jgi:hypothetical protein